MREKYDSNKYHSLKYNWSYQVSYATNKTYYACKMIGTQRFISADLEELDSVSKMLILFQNRAFVSIIPITSVYSLPSFTVSDWFILFVKVCP